MGIALIEGPAAAALTREVCAGELVQIGVVLLDPSVDDNDEDVPVHSRICPGMVAVHIHIRYTTELTRVIDSP